MASIVIDVINTYDELHLIQRYSLIRFEPLAGGNRYFYETIMLASPFRPLYIFNGNVFSIGIPTQTHTWCEVTINNDNTTTYTYEIDANNSDDSIGSMDSDDSIGSMDSDDSGAHEDELFNSSDFGELGIDYVIKLSLPIDLTNNNAIHNPKSLGHYSYVALSKPDKLKYRKMVQQGIIPPILNTGRPLTPPLIKPIKTPTKKTLATIMREESRRNPNLKITTRRRIRKGKKGGSRRKFKH